MKVYRIILISVSILVILSGCSNKKEWEESLKQWEQAVKDRDEVIATLREQLEEAQGQLAECQQSVEAMMKQQVTQTISKILLNEDEENTEKALVKRHVLIQSEFTKEAISQELTRLYNGAREKKGWKHHPATTMIALFAYKTEDHYKSRSGQWSAMLSWDEGDPQPKINFNETEFMMLETPSQVKWGFSEEQRMKLYRELYAALWKAAESNLQQDEWISMKPIADKYNLTQEQTEDIMLEGSIKNWPE